MLSLLICLKIIIHLHFLSYFYIDVVQAFGRQSRMQRIDLATQEGRAMVLTDWPLGNMNEIFAIFKQLLVIGGWGISGEIALLWISLDLTDDKSIFTQISVAIRRH